jgi:hypothetical protein
MIGLGSQSFCESSKNASSKSSVLMWWKSAVNLSFFLSLATFRMFQRL